MPTRAAELIATLNLLPHPEGGHYREVFRSAANVRPNDARSERSALTTIYFLLRAGEQSRLHRVASDEVWHFYEGDPLELIWVDAERASVQYARLGPAGSETTPIAVVPAGCWQAARSTRDYSLVGCTVGPGFDFTDFQMLSDDPPTARELCDRLPELRQFL